MTFNFWSAPTSDGRWVQVAQASSLVGPTIVPGHTPATYTSHIIGQTFLGAASTRYRKTTAVAQSFRPHLGRAPPFPPTFLRPLLQRKVDIMAKHW